MQAGNGQPSHKLQDMSSDTDSEINNSLKIPMGFYVLMGFCFLAAVFSVAGFVWQTVYENTHMSPSMQGSVFSPSMLLAIGIANSLIGSLQTASGYCAQRIAHKDMADNADPKKKVSRHPMYIMGIALLATGTITAVINLGILGQSVTAPFAALTLIYNALLARFVLRETISKYDIYASVLVVTGVAISVSGVAMADNHAHSFVFAELRDMLFRSIFPSLYTISVISVLITWTIHVDRYHLQKSVRALCCYSISAGMLAGFTSVLVKCSVEIIKGVSQRQTNDLKNPFIYLFMLGIPLCLISQLRHMNHGFEHFGTLKFVPPYHAFIIMSNMLNGMIYFEEYKYYPVIGMVLFSLGCCVTIAGVGLLFAKADPGLPRPWQSSRKQPQLPLPIAATLEDVDLDSPSLIRNQIDLALDETL